MGLDVEKLLCEYFSKEEVQDALQEIGEPITGTKEELVDVLSENWESHNRDKYELLDFTEEETLQDICEHYNLDDSPAAHGVLKRRIKKANLLNSTGKPRPTAHVDRSHDSLIPKKKSNSDAGVTDVHFHFGSVSPKRRWLIGIAIAITGIIVTIIFSV